MRNIELLTVRKVTSVAWVSEAYPCVGNRGKHCTGKLCLPMPPICRGDIGFLTVNKGPACHYAAARQVAASIATKRLGTQHQVDTYLPANSYGEMVRQEMAGRRSAKSDMISSGIPYSTPRHAPRRHGRTRKNGPRNHRSTRMNTDRCRRI